MKREGDKISDRNFDAVINWMGIFSQAEYKTKKWSAFVTVTGNETSYQRFDYFKRKDLVIDGKTFEMKVGYGDKFFYNGTDTLSAFNLLSTITQNGDTTFVKNLVNGQTRYIIGAKEYTFESDEARTAETRRKWFLGYTIKGGVNYNLNSIFNIYMNGGYMTIPMPFDNVFSTRHKEFIDVKNQNVYAIELGLGIHWKKLAANINSYYTYWANKPYQGGRTITTADGTFSYNINGMNARHMGIELDAEYRLNKYLDFDVAASYGDWVYDAAKSVYIFDENDVLRDSLVFSAKGVHVGDAAQSQVSAAVSIRPINGLYIKPRFTYFGRNYSKFDPFSLEYRKFGSEVKDYRDRESWIMPDYYLFDVSAGYEFSFSAIRFNFNITCSNIANTKYITDANNNGIYGSNGPPVGQGFNAQSATVFFGQGRRWTAGIKVTF
jgi:outer membrane receptor protein involved in Fe transport